MKTNASDLATVQPEEALTLAAWVEAHAQSECDDDYDDWVAKCTRIAVALRQLATLTKTPKYSSGPGLCNEVLLPKIDGPAVLTGRELASINKQSTPHSWPFDKDSVYGCGPEDLNLFLKLNEHT